MFKFIRQSLGRSETTPDTSSPSPNPVSRAAQGVNASAQSTPVRSVQPSTGGDKETTDDYFNTLGKMEEAISKHEYGRAARLARENLRQLPAADRFLKHEYGALDIYFPVLHVGGTVLALVGDDDGLSEMRTLITSNHNFEPWADIVKQHEESRVLFAAILEAVQQNPGCRQTDLKSLVGAKDGHRVSTLIGWLEKAGKITREKQEKTYLVWPAGALHPPMQSPQRNVQSHRLDRKPPRMREIDVASIPYVPLPKSPLRWEEAKMRSDVAANLPEVMDHFEVREAEGWAVDAIEKIPAGEKPDTAFRLLFPLDSGILMIDDLGKAEGLGQIPAAALRYSRSGELLAKKPLFHGVYRIDANPLGRGFIALSKDCVIHAYDDAVESILETKLADSPEIRAIRKRVDIQDDQLKNHIRCVTLSYDRSRYIFTVVDEAWCVGVDGRGLWGAKLPIKEGWTRIAEPDGTFGTSEEIQQALSLMGMVYPFASEDLKKRYRQLAKEWHPDLNPSNPSAMERMKELTGAMQLLTGVSENALQVYTGVQYTQELSRIEIEVGDIKVTLTMSSDASEIDVADWIYAASFAGRSNAVFLAGYSGRVIVLSESGEPLRAYDIGSVPRRIVDTGDYLYILTDTRLYVLRAESLYAVIDTFDGGDLFVAQTGFGLLETKRFRWFREDGTYTGSVVTKDPIRRVYATPEGITVETRTRRAFVRGAPAWWETAP